MSETAFKYRFRLEMRIGQDMREVNADNYGVSDGWMIFYRANPQGGPRKEYWRVKSDDVISMETK